MRRVLVVFWAGAAMLLGGCQQIAWKPGASAADLERDTAACREQFAAEPAVQSCLKQRGWVLRQPAAATAPATDAGSDTDSDANIDTASPVVSAPNASEPSSTNTPATISTTAAPTTTPAPSNTAVPAPIKPTSVKPKAIDPLAPMLIQSWWKVGAQAADLTADQDACVDTLGAAHRPDLQNRLYTHAMIDCLHAHGWSGH